MESKLTQGKRRNSKVYVAKSGAIPVGLLEKFNAHNNNNANSCEGEFPTRDSVLQMREVFENATPSERSTGTDGGKRHNVVTHSQNVLLLDAVGSSAGRATTSGTTGTSETDCRFKSNKNSCQHLESFSISSVRSKNEFSSGEIASGSSRSQSEIKDTFNDLSTVNIEDGPNSKSILPGSLILQPASNVRGSLVKAEYLILNKFNDIRQYSSCKKKINVDELDKRMEDILPVNHTDDMIHVDFAPENTDELQCQLDNHFVFVFERPGIKVNRSVLRTKAPRAKKQVSFSHQPASVFEYPPDNTPPDQISAEPCDSEPDLVQRRYAGELGLYQPRLLEQCTMIPYYGKESLSAMNPQSQQPFLNAGNLQPKDSTVQKSFHISCSAEKSSWSGSNSGTELLF